MNPLFRPNDVEEIYAELQGFQIELAEDPSVRGASYLQEVTALCRHHVNRVTFHLNDMAKRRINMQRTLFALEALFKTKSNSLMANDPVVKSQKSVADRQALVGFMLSSELRDIDGIKAELRELEIVETSLRLTHKELKDVSSEIRNQIKILEIELKSKSYFGDESDIDRQARAAEQNKYQKEAEEFMKGELDF